MARTLTEIYDALAVTKSEQLELADLAPDIDTAQSLLTQLTTTSRVASWRLMLWTVSVAIWTHEKLWDLFHAEITALAAASHIGTLRWYVEKARQFQYGFALEIINNVPAYATDEPAARIVARAAGKEDGGMVLLKVAKLSGTDVVPLSGGELDAFNAYIDEVKMAGVVVNVLSAAADLLKVTATVYYNPLVMASNGSLILTPAVKPVEDAINAFISSLPFNGAMVVTDMVDAMQAAEGVVNPVVTLVEARYGILPFAPVPVQYVANSGHMKIDPATPLSATITYMPYVV